MTAWVDDRNAALLTDLYEITMAGAYDAAGDDATVTFELWVRSLPETRTFLVVAGVDDALSFLDGFAFDDASIEYLRGLDRFDDGFLDGLGELRFTGDVWAMPEGTIAFAREPILRVTAPIAEAQLVETFLLNTVGFQTMLASKAARVTLAAGDRAWTDFGARRAHGADAALKGARAAYMGGAASTSLVLAGREFGIPVTGTMAHSYVLANPDELEAFVAFGRAYPDDAVLLVDTFDTIRGVEIAVEAAGILAEEGISVSGIRLDSGDLGDLARRSREILDIAGLQDVRIVASGGLDEYAVADLADAPIDAFGVGTRVMTSEDAPNLDIIYKLVQDDTGPVMKTSTDKATLPGVKQVHRSFDDGIPTGDVIALASEPVPEGATPLLVRCMEGGRRTVRPRSIDGIRRHVLDGLEALPDEFRSLDPPSEPYPVAVSDELASLRDRLVEAADHPSR